MSGNPRRLCLPTDDFGRLSPSKFLIVMTSPRHTRRLLILLLIAGLVPIAALRGQETDSGSEASAAVSDAPAQERSERIRDEMTTSLARAEELQRELSGRLRELEVVRQDLTAAREAGDTEQIKALEESIEVGNRWIAGLRAEIDDEEKLYQQAAERFQIAQRQADMASRDGAQSTSQDGSGVPLIDTLQRRGQVTQAEQEALLAKQQVTALRTEIEIIERRQKRIHSETDEINRLLDAGRQLERQQRVELTEERQRLTDERRTLDDRLNDLRSQLVLAETTLRIKDEAAERELTDYKYWQRQLLTSLGLLLAVVAALFLLRFLVSRYVDDPDRRYAANRALSIAMTFVLFIGLGVIFLRQFPNLFTGIGVVLAGVAIALQEVILSFFGFFAIRGARGYRVGDWVRIGDSYGEVIDIGLLVTILEEVTPIDFSSPRGGTKTGALTWINNNAIFREKMTNYTRGFPYIWTTLIYVVTFESNWQHAEEILHQVIGGHDEIKTTAKLAHKRVAKVASDFAIKVDSTEPRYRTWTADSGVELRARFMVHPRRRRALIDPLPREVMTAIAAAEDVDFAYTTMRVIPTPEHTG